MIIGLIVGLYGGFKVANSQYRLAQEKDLNRSIAGATSGLPTGSAGAGMDQTRQMIDRAKNNPQDIEAQLDAADQFMQISRPDQALPFLQQAHQIDQQDPRALAGLGMASFMSGNYDQAIDWASRSLSIRPENPGASFLLIASYIRTNQKLDEAERLIGQLEAGGVDPAMIRSVRDELATARGGAKSKSATMLDHGPAEAKPGTVR